MKMSFWIATCFTLILALSVQAHDTWVQTNAAIVRVGDVVHVDLMLGNHGNDHRDFKLAGKVDAPSTKIELIAPDGTRQNLQPSLVDIGYEAKQGYLTVPVTPPKAGLYMIACSSDQVVTYAPTRSVKSGKTFILATKSLDRPPQDAEGFGRVLGHALELVPETSTVTPMGPGTPIRVKLIYKGKPLAEARVSFIPRGQTLTESFDPRFERKTDKDGRANFEPTEGNYYLVAAHVEEPTEAGKGYESTKYSATLTVLVPGLCPCCGE